MTFLYMIPNEMMFNFNMLNPRMQNRIFGQTNYSIIITKNKDFTFLDIVIFQLIFQPQ